MATSVYAFRGVAVAEEDNSSAYVSINFDPPANLKGKQCYVECTVWNWDFGTSPTPALTSRDAFAFSADWSQVACGTIVDGQTFEATPPTTNDVLKNFKAPGRAPMGVFYNNISYSTGPVLCFIPNGSHTVTFQVYRPDGEDVCGGAFVKNLFYAVFKIVAADSRQPQIGV